MDELRDKLHDEFCDKLQKLFNIALPEDDTKVTYTTRCGGTRFYVSNDNLRRFMLLGPTVCAYYDPATIYVTRRIDSELCCGGAGPEEIYAVIKEEILKYAALTGTKMAAARYREKAGIEIPHPNIHVNTRRIECRFNDAIFGQYSFCIPGTHSLSYVDLSSILYKAHVGMGKYLRMNGMAAEPCGDNDLTPDSDDTSQRLDDARTVADKGWTPDVPAEGIFDKGFRL